jgi:hypothetical protein
MIEMWRNKHQSYFFSLIDEACKSNNFLLYIINFLHTCVNKGIQAEIEILMLEEQNCDFLRSHQADILRVRVRVLKEWCRIREWKTYQKVTRFGLILLINVKLTRKHCSVKKSPTILVSLCVTDQDSLAHFYVFYFVLVLERTSFNWIRKLISIVNNVQNATS